MSAAARQGDKNLIHCSPHRIKEGSPNVFINNRPAARVGDRTTRHLKPGIICPPHTAKINSGAATIFINGQYAARVGSTIARCTKVVEGSPNVIHGGPTAGGDSGYGLQAVTTVGGALAARALGF